MHMSQPCLLLLFIIIIIYFIYYFLWFFTFGLMHALPVGQWHNYRLMKLKFRSYVIGYLMGGDDYVIDLRENIFGTSLMCDLPSFF